MNENESFEYTYCAPEQEEIKRIRQKYLPPEEDKMEQLLRLDAMPARKGTAWAIVVGVIGALIMGSGMSCCMVYPQSLMAPGIVVGILGMGIAALALPLYRRITDKERQRIAPEILRLTEELMK